MDDMEKLIADLENRLEASGKFRHTTKDNVMDKLSDFLNGEDPEQADKDIDTLSKAMAAMTVVRLIKEDEIKQEKEALEHRAESSLFTAIHLFLESDDSDRDACLIKVMRVLNNYKDKYDKQKEHKHGLI